LNEQGNPQPPGTMGEIVIKEPLPPGCLKTLLNNENLCQEVYFSSFPGYYKTGDAGYLDRDDYIWVMARTDDVINGTFQTLIILLHVCFLFIFY
jgi:propionyl-CoA synthetase